MKKVGIVILNWNGFSNTSACLESIKKADHRDVDSSVIIVDNASSDDSIKQIKKNYPDIHIVENHANLGFSQGNNVGIHRALSLGSKYIFLLNNDTIIDKNTIARLVNGAEINNAGIVAPKIYFQAGYEYHETRYAAKDRGKVIWYAGGVIDWKNCYGIHLGVDEVDRGETKWNQERITDFASGCAMLVKKEVFEKVGYFDKKYYLYYEDLDFNVRVKKMGYTIRYFPGSFLWHKNASSSGYSGSELQDYYISRNRLLFGMRFAPLNTKFALLKESVKLFRQGRAWQKKGVKDFFCANFGKGSFRV